jgi:hypothetical protein
MPLKKQQASTAASPWTAVMEARYVLIKLCSRAGSETCSGLPEN